MVGLGVALALALAVTASGLLLSSAPASDLATASFTPKKGAYEGKTKQGLVVTFDVDGKGKVKGPRWRIQYGPCLGTFRFKGTVPVNSKRKFKFTTGPFDLSAAKFTGKFVSKRKVKGKATGDFGFENIDCTGPRTVKYTARRS